MNEAAKSGIKIKMNCFIQSIRKNERGFVLSTSDEIEIVADKIIIATGGSPKPEGFDWLIKLGHSIEPPVPSLFTFNIPDNPVTELMGVAAENALVKIQGTKLKQAGPLLITHWGMSGPAVLKLSSWGARVLNEMNYDFKINVCWNGIMNEEGVRELIAEEFDDIKRKKISNVKLLALPARLWLYLVNKCGINSEMNWADLSKEKLNRLINAICNDEYHVKEKTTFREEFVTCGGVRLEQVNFNTMESKVCRGIYFTGEVLDIDAITGGFNFQSAWTTGFIAGKLLSENYITPA